MKPVEFSDSRGHALTIFDVIFGLGALLLLLALGTNVLVAGVVAVLVGIAFRAVTNHSYYRWTRTADGRAFTWSKGRVIRTIPNDGVVEVSEGRLTAMGPCVFVRVDAQSAHLLTSRAQRRTQQFVILKRRLNDLPSLRKHLGHLGQQKYESSQPLSGL